MAPQVQTTPRESAQHEWRLAAASATARWPRSAGSRLGDATESGPTAEEAAVPAAADAAEAEAAEAELPFPFFEAENEAEEPAFEEDEKEEEDDDDEELPPPPRPSLPSLFEPHAQTPPSAVAASEWCLPRATSTTRRELEKPPPLLNLLPPPGKNTRLGSSTAP